MATSTLSERDATAIPVHLALASRNHGMPSVSIPENFTNRNGFVEFTIPTNTSEVSATAWNHTIEIKGRTEELLFLRLVRPEWLPGVPGNGKAMQTVVFEPTGPRLFFRHGGSRLSAPHIVIKRISRISYSVKIPATASQIALIQRAWDEFYEQMKRDEKEKSELEWRQKKEADRMKCAPKSAAEFREYLINLIRTMESWLTDSFENRDDFYRFDDTAKARIKKCWDEIEQVIGDGRVIPMERTRHQEGNVIFLGHR